jgi:CRP-like cAMP-binding protein
MSQNARSRSGIQIATGVRNVVDKPSNSLFPELWAALDGVRSPSCYAGGKRLFHYGEPARGLYVVEKGNINLFLSSESGNEQLFETVGPGSVLGLSEAISGATHKLTAVAGCRAEVSFINRQELLRLLRQNPACCMQLVRLLSEDLHLLYHRFQCNSQGNPKPERGRALRHPQSSREDRPN